MSQHLRTSTGGLDPAERERGYWRRFRERTVALAGPELVRRRARSQLTVSDVVASWSRVVVPAALAAAVVGTLMLGGGTMPAEPEPVAVEELLDLGSEAVPPLLAADAPDETVILAAEPF